MRVSGTREADSRGSFRRRSRRLERSRVVTPVAVLFAVAAAAAAVGMPYGVNVHIPDATLLDRIAETGVGWIRVDFVWAYVEPQQDVFDWSLYDPVVENALARGLRIYATLAYTPAWATGGPEWTGVPSRTADWEDVCSRAVQRYAGRIDAWGMWNEPNVSRFWSGSRADYIYKILKPGSAAVRAADPDTKVCGPELAHLESANWASWLDEVIRRAGADLDIVTHHLYPDGSDSRSVARALIDDRAHPWEPLSVRQVLAAAGWLGRPFWLSETGYNAGIGSIGETIQASVLRGILADLLSPARLVPWIHNVFIYEGADDPRFPTVGFGLLGSPPEYRRKTSHAELSRITREVATDDAEIVFSSFPGSLTPGQRATATVVVRNNGTTSWSEVEAVRLGAFGDADPLGEPRQLLAEGEIVAPGDERSFSFEIAAPTGVEDTTLWTEWQMVRDGRWWFGELLRLPVRVAAPEPPDIMYLPAAAAIAGLNGTDWHTDVVVHNRGTTALTYGVALLEQGRDNTTPRSVWRTLEPGRTERLFDVIGTLFGVRGAASLRIEAPQPGLLVAGRTATAVPSGSCGQYLPALRETDAAREGSHALLAALASASDRTSGFRTNLGLISLVGQPVVVDIDLDDGSVRLGTVRAELQPHGFVQINEVFRRVTAESVADGLATVRVVTPGGAVIPYASVVDNGSGDPVLVPPAKPSSETLVVPTAANNNGLNGTWWRSDLALSSTSSTDETVSVTFQPASGAPATADVFLPRTTSVSVEDAVGSVFHSRGSGALLVRPGKAALVAASRTYTEDGTGSYGQFVPALPISSATRFGQETRLVQLSRSADTRVGFRTNLGFVNLSSIPITVLIKLLDAAGGMLRMTQLEIPASGWHQLTDALAGLPGDAAVEVVAVVRCLTHGGQFVAYASVIDNGSGDPFFIPGSSARSPAP